MSKPFILKYAEFFDMDRGLLSFEKKFFPINYIINAQKAGTMFVMFTLMLYFNNFSLGAWVYLALHGSYGILWFIKDLTFPDKGFQIKIGFIGILATSIVLLAYWTIGFLMMSGNANQNPSPERIFFCILIYVIGANLMMCCDIQKYVSLKYK